MAPKLTKAQTEMLATIIGAGESGVYVPQKSQPLKKLVELKLVETNKDYINEAGEIATRVTAQGVEAMTPAAPETETATETKVVFEIESGIPVPRTRQGGKGGGKYPFAKMEVGQSFHVAATEENDNPAKNLASTVSAAKKRYKVDGKLTRNFVVRRVDETDPKGNGARVFRIELPVEATEAAE